MEKLDYIQKNNYLSNQFLFGEDIEVDQMEMNKILRGSKGFN